MYKEGLGVPQDYQETMKWYRLAAEQGDSWSQYSLGSMYDEGQGVPQDYISAHMWYNISASNDYLLGQIKRDEIAEKMTAEQIAEAQKLAKECVAKNYEGC